MAVGETSSGKSISLKIISMLFGGKFISLTSSESISTELMKSTIPICWDDPKFPSTVSKALVATFQRGGKQTKSGGIELPETTFILSVNFTLEDTRYISCYIYSGK